VTTCHGIMVSREHDVGSGDLSCGHAMMVSRECSSASWVINKQASLCLLQIGFDGCEKHDGCKTRAYNSQ
jgi:hypothetical protein